MTLAEFKAWFEGFTESMDAAPTTKQWKRIKERVSQINGVAVTREVIYRDRYWPSLYNPTTTWLVGTSTCLAAPDLDDATTMSTNLLDLGRAEYNQVLSS